MVGLVHPSIGAKQAPFADVSLLQSEAFVIAALLWALKMIPMIRTVLRTPRFAQNQKVALFIAVVGLEFLACSQAVSAPGPALSPAWEPIGLSGGGGMFSPAIAGADPNLMLINCDMSAAYLSEDGGHNWRMLNQAQLRSDTRCRPAFHPKNPNIIYASSGGRLRVSHDRGRTFTPVGNLSENLAGEIAINPLNPDELLVGTWNGRAWISLDAGATFTMCAGPEGRILGFHFGHAGKARSMFAATEAGIWRSDDGGKSWTEKTSGLPWKEIQGFAGGDSAGKGVALLYCTIKSKTTSGAFEGGVYRSGDGGESWQRCLGKGLNKETTKADEWAFGPISQYVQILTTDANPRTVYVMNTSTGFNPPHSDTVYRSDDGGETWRATYFLDPRFSQYNVAPDYVTASTGQSFKGGETPFGAAICNSDPDRLMLVRGECHITHNGGQTWFCGSTDPAPSQKPGPGSAWVCNGLVVTTTWHYYVDPFEPNRHYICYTDLGWARSLDAGKSWIWWSQKSWAPWRNTCYELALDPEVPGKMWGAFSDVHDIPNDNIISEHHRHNLPGGVCLSLDFGATWKAAGDSANARDIEGGASGLPPKAVTSIVLDLNSPRGSRTLYAGVFEQGVFRSADDGRTWMVKTNGLGDALNRRVSRVLLHRDGTLFAMICAKRSAPGKPLLREGVGLYQSKDGGDSWHKVNATRDFLYPKDFSVDPKDSRRILIGVCDTNWQDKAGGCIAPRMAGGAGNASGAKARRPSGGISIRSTTGGST